MIAICIWRVIGDRRTVVGSNLTEPEGTLPMDQSEGTNGKWEMLIKSMRMFTIEYPRNIFSNAQVQGLRQVSLHPAESAEVDSSGEAESEKKLNGIEYGSSKHYLAGLTQRRLWDWID